MPGTAGKILQQIGAAENQKLNLADVREWGSLKTGSSLTRCESLFPRIEKDKEKTIPLKDKSVIDLKPEIDYEDFAKADLRVATILEAQMVPKSTKLVKLKVDIGEERTIVAGIGKDYRPEELIGKKIVIVANLKPAKLMGVESRGMLLASGGGKELFLASFADGAKAGTKVK